MTPEELISAYRPPVQELCLSLRALVRQVLPDMQEIVFSNWKNVSYGTGASRSDKDLICYIAPFTQSVNLGFYRGASLADPERLLSGTGKALRHIKFAPGGQVHEDAVISLLKAAHFERLGDELRAVV